MIARTRLLSTDIQDVNNKRDILAIIPSLQKGERAQPSNNFGACGPCCTGLTVSLHSRVEDNDETEALHHSMLVNCVTTAELRRAA